MLFLIVRRSDRHIVRSLLADLLQKLRILPPGHGELLLTQTFHLTVGYAYLLLQ